ncbi:MULTISPECIES: class I SAM-dependent methyltransferase [Mycobacteroides]|jgi:methyltransferase (TIGR00027 family)|uniref:S-adenosyl-L-methionine-dependent methyltransferase n=1 Tax=Mycobacteroides chelonae TaxID=1774 RepID=A0A1S1LLZ6_MYCCH|nr:MULTISPECIES: class I SAM-dependent methyltransferase [Mycobacteroides]KRQ19369.1 SAM-dependent methyltransferase [Mycobacteroides sp. H003]KRQ28346.1 SAM-dependent methyltransferase [Mycobacteroides sp. H092]KRQ41165.1 SAM-dependent methyltransferase [Mycobacteroides sp. H101]KRQ43546.1 SAM-dependent methyltransferase [Mycobacteroides sp. H063]KRQ55496.1 SAM-dependent methyltransferase [Mycobacteroides sp. HXVII]
MTRTEGDQWDIVSSVGFTALMVSSFRALETTRSEPLIRDEHARAFVEASGEPHLTEALASPRPESEWDVATTYLVNHLAVRTKYFDEFFTTATASGVRQVVILAAGLDARVYRLPWPHGTVVYELDQPKVLEFKDHVLAEENAVAQAERREVAADLRDDWIAALGAEGFDAGKPTAWLAEGLLAYLPGAAQDALFEKITAHSAPGSFLATEWRRRVATAGQWQDAVNKLKPDFLQNVSIGDLIYDDERKDPIEWLGEHGWHVDVTNRLEQAAAYGRPAPEEHSEITSLWSDAYFITATR